MGFIPYHLSRFFSGRLNFLDLRALSTQDLSACHLLKKFPRTENGIKISYDEFYGLLPVLNRQCGIAKPDIVYDMGYDMRKGVLQDNDYIITYREKRSVSGKFSTRLIGSELFVAVRRDLAAQFKLKDIDGNKGRQANISTSTIRKDNGDTEICIGWGLQPVRNKAKFKRRSNKFIKPLVNLQIWVV